MGSGLDGDTVQCRFGLEVVDGEFAGGDEMCMAQARASPALLREPFYGLESESLETMYGLALPRGMGLSPSHREEQCMGWVEVVCIAPPHAAGVVTVEVRP